MCLIQSILKIKQFIKTHIEDMITRGSNYLSTATLFTPGTPIEGGQGFNSDSLNFYLAKEDEQVNLGIIDPSLTTFNIGELFAPSNTLDQEATIIYSPATTINFISGGTLFNGQIINTNQIFTPDSDFSKVA